jgi:hypothetical protein
MARARNIKPGFFANEELVELPFSTRLLFIGLWTIADREGRLEDKPKRIKMVLFPADNLDVDEALAELSDKKFILRYSVDGIQYIQILAFKKHQNPHKDEKGSSIPEPRMHDASTVQAPCKNDGNPADSLIPDSLNQDKPIVRTSSARFQEFWDTWPKSQRKVGKGACEKKWKSQKLDTIADQIIQHVTELKKTKQWTDGFEPSPITYINQGRWADEIFDGNGNAPANTKPWYISSTGIELKAKELGLELMRGEVFPDFKVRVYRAAEITHDMVRQANQDFK